MAESPAMPTAAPTTPPMTLAEASAKYTAVNNSLMAAKADRAKVQRELTDLDDNIAALNKSLEQARAALKGSV